MGLVATHKWTEIKYIDLTLVRNLNCLGKIANNIIVTITFLLWACSMTCDSAGVTLPTYCIAGNFSGQLILAIWRFSEKRQNRNTINFQRSRLYHAQIIKFAKI